MLISQPAREVTYAARRSDLQLIKTARYPTLGPGNVKVGETPGVAVQFVEGVYRIPLEGKVVTKHGVAVEAAELHPWLQSHRLFDDMQEGFVKVEQAAPPLTAAEIKAVTRAQIRVQPDVLEEIVAQERAGWNRPELIEVAEDALSELRTLQAEMEAEKGKAK